MYGVVVVVLLAAWMVAGDAWWLQPFNLTTFWWLVPALPLGLLAVVARRLDVAAWLAIPVVAWSVVYATAFVPVAGEVVRDAPADLTIASFNTWVASPDIEHVIDLVDRVDPDVVLAQEVFPSREERLREALAARLPHVAAAQSEGVGGVMVLSRHPIVDVVEVDPGNGARRSLVTTLQVGDRRVQVATMHLRSPCPGCGDSVAQRLMLEARSRRDEVAAVLGHLDPDVPAIVGGDFNSTERSMAYRDLVAAGFADPQRDAGAGLGLTWPAGDQVPPLFRIDWIMSRGLAPVAAWVGPNGTSDHHPVVAKLSFSGSAPAAVAPIRSTRER